MTDSANLVRRVSLEPMLRIAVLVRINGHRPNTQLVGRAERANRDLPAIGHQHFGDHAAPYRCPAALLETLRISVAFPDADRQDHLEVLLCLGLIPTPLTWEEVPSTSEWRSWSTGRGHRPRSARVYASAPLGANTGSGRPISATSLTASITVPSGRTTAAVARPRRSQRASSVPGSAATTTAPRRANSSCCCSESGAELTTANRCPTTSSNRLPFARTGLGHNRPASPRRPPCLITNALWRSAGVVLSTTLSRRPGIRCRRGSAR